MATASSGAAHRTTGACNVFVDAGRAKACPANKVVQLFRPGAPLGATVPAHNSRALILSSLPYRHALHGWSQRVPNRLYLTDRLILHVAVR
jgi:hypothetical protein